MADDTSQASNGTRRGWWMKIYPHAGETDTGRHPYEEGFAPADPLDGRREGNWRTRYPPEIHRHIAAEAVYLAAQGLLFIILALLAWLLANGYTPNFLFPPDNRSAWQLLGLGALAFFGGALGGTLFGLKWLYHSVAKGIWSLDRRLWRLFTPWISGILGLIVVALIAGNVLTVFRAESMRQPATVFSVAALVGLFSDMTLGKLAEVAKALFGTTTDDSKTGTRSPRKPPNGENVS